MFVVNEPELARVAQKIVPKLWGVEYWLTNNDKYCLKFLKVNPGFICSVHKHEEKDETFIGVQGTVLLNVEPSEPTIHNPLCQQETHAISTGKQFRIAPGTFHWFEAAGSPALVMEVSTPHDDKDVVRREDSCRKEEQQ